jgi:hypothetical protein
LFDLPFDFIKTKTQKYFHFAFFACLLAGYLALPFKLKTTKRFPLL